MAVARSPRYQERQDRGGAWTKWMCAHDLVDPMKKKRFGRLREIPVYAWSPLVLVVGGAFALISGVVDIGKADALTDRGVQTTAMVTSQQVSCGGINSVCSMDVEYTFTTPDGVRHAASDNNPEGVGATIDIWYDPQNPDGLSTMHAPDNGKGIGMMVLGAVFFVIGLGLFIWLSLQALRT